MLCATGMLAPMRWSSCSDLTVTSCWIHASDRRAASGTTAQGTGGNESRRVQPLGQPCEKDEHARQDDHSATELVPAGEQRRRPACCEEEQKHREDGPARSDRQRKHQREAEDRGQDHLVHALVLDRIDRKPEVVEVQETAREA